MHKMTLTRAGVIIVKPEQGTKCQCVVENHTTYYYKSIITFIDPKLDEKGFVIDHGELSTIISDFYRDKKIPSCELMVQQLAEMVSDLLVDRNMKPESVFMEITNIPDGSQGYLNTTYFPTRKA